MLIHFIQVQWKKCWSIKILNLGDSDINLKKSEAFLGLFWDFIRVAWDKCWQTKKISCTQSFTKYRKVLLSIQFIKFKCLTSYKSEYSILNSLIFSKFPGQPWYAVKFSIFNKQTEIRVSHFNLKWWNGKFKLIDIWTRSIEIASSGLL